MHSRHPTLKVNAIYGWICVKVMMLKASHIYRQRDIFRLMPKASNVKSNFVTTFDTFGIGDIY